MRASVYRQRILTLFEDDHLLSIAEIHQKVSGADYSTIYRNVAQLVADGKIRKVVFDKGHVKYEIAKDTERHDHFFCVDCGDVEKVLVPRDMLALSKDHTVEDLVIRGLCGHCN